MVSPSCTAENARSGLSKGNAAVPNCTGAPVTLTSTYHLVRGATVTVAVAVTPGPTTAVIVTEPGARPCTVPPASTPGTFRLGDRQVALVILPTHTPPSR